MDLVVDDGLAPGASRASSWQARLVRRKKSARQKQALGLTGELLRRMVAACPQTLQGRRNAALISVGYDTLCRSSELALLTVEHLSPCRSSILIPRSKSDPYGEGRIAYLSEATSRLVEAWLTLSGLEEGPLCHHGSPLRRIQRTASLFVSSNGLRKIRFEPA